MVKAASTIVVLTRVGKMVSQHLEALFAHVTTDFIMVWRTLSAEIEVTNATWERCRMWARINFARGLWLHRQGGATAPSPECELDAEPPL